MNSASEKINPWTLYQQLWFYIPDARRVQCCFLLLLMMGASLAEVISIGAVIPFLGVLLSPERVFQEPLVQPLIEFLGLSSPTELLWPLTIAFSLAAVLAGAMRLSLLWAQTRIGHSIGADWSVDIFHKTLHQSYAVHAARNSSEVVAGISHKVNQVVAHTLVPILLVISSAMLFAAIVSTLFLVNATIAVSVIAGFGSIYFVVLVVSKKYLLQYSKRISEEQNRVVKILQEGLGGIRDILLEGSQKTFSDNFQKADWPLRRARANTRIIAESPRYVVEATGVIVIAGLAYVLSSQSGGLVDAVPVLGALALGAQRMLPVLQQGFAAWSSIRADLHSVQDVVQLLSQPLPAEAEAEALLPIVFQNELKLEQVDFKYTPDSQNVLHAIDLTIPKGSKVGFIGETGSGKTTLLDIVMGLLEPGEGHLVIDGLAINSLNCRSWQKHIAHVPQSIYLADATISENIAFGTPPGEIDTDRVIYAARIAQLENTIESWKDKYDTRIGENGIRLSGGQRQRIGIARAIYKQASVIILDEATSALDNETERRVISAIESLSGEPTVLMIAHRLTTLKSCDFIVKLGSGAVVNIGSYSELVA